MARPGLSREYARVGSDLERSYMDLRPGMEEFVESEEAVIRARANQGIFGVSWLKNPMAARNWQDAAVAMFILLIVVIILLLVVDVVAGTNMIIPKNYNTGPSSSTSAATGQPGGPSGPAPTTFTSSKPLEQCLSDKCNPVLGTSEDNCQRLVDMWRCVHTDCAAEYEQELAVRRQSGGEGDLIAVKAFTDSWNVTASTPVNMQQACEIFNGPFYTGSSNPTMAPT